MKAATVTVGTTLEILAPYLPYGINLKLERAQQQVAFAQLDGLRKIGEDYWQAIASEGRPTQAALQEDESPVFRNAFYPLDCCLPVLRPFSQLNEPLLDGTVPAIEVAKLILELNEDHCEDGYLAGMRASMDLIGCDCMVFLPGENWPCLTIYADWAMSAHEAMTPPAAYDYLRHHHFAVGLEEGQYIHKTA